MSSKTLIADDQKTDHRFYGRRRGRPFSPQAQQDFERLLTVYGYDAHRFFSDGSRAKILEIGFGSGEHLLECAQHFPQALCLGVEVFENGVLKCLRSIAAQEVENVQVQHGDVREVLQSLSHDVLEPKFDKIFIMFPDPWPKKRHNKRRLLSSAFLSRLAKITKPTTVLCIATDHPDYVAWLQALFENHSAVRETSVTVNRHPYGFAASKYAQKARRAGRDCYYFQLRLQPVPESRTFNYEKNPS